MKFTPTPLPGVWIVDLEKHEDDRGFFARSWCQEESATQGLNPQLVQCNISYNKQRGTIRGMHLQASPHQEAKWVRCTRGAIFDVALDLRPSSPTFKQWAGVELTQDNGRTFYIPEGCAHGFQALAPDTEVLYQMTAFYHPESARGFLWNDPAFGIQWPLREGLTISKQDRSFPPFSNESLAC